jgi:hypothetical protein
MVDVNATGYYDSAWKKVVKVLATRKAKINDTNATVAR